MCHPGDCCPTSGDASVCGLSVRTKLVEVYRRTGFCPQFGGLWEHLSVRHHLEYYLVLKGCPESDATREARAVERDYGLADHSAKRVKELSGGTKRKLSAAIALSCGRPDVCFLDEPTTGVDASTRRFIWDRIKAGTDGKVVLLTTHYMDEADALAQRIGIMANSRLKCIGSAQHIKSKHGGGSRVETRGPPDKADLVHDLFARRFPEAVRLEAHAGALSYELAPNSSIADAFKILEDAKDDTIIDNYSISQTTLEQVFLNVAEAARPGPPAP